MSETAWESRWGTVLCLVCFRRTYPEHVILRCPKSESHPGSTISSELLRQHQPVFISPHEAFDLGANLRRRYDCPEGLPHSYELACPRCEAPLRLSLDARGRRLVFFVGPPGSGKTMLFYAIKRTLGYGPTAATIFPAQAADDFERLVENPLNKGELPAGTVDALARDGRAGSAASVPEGRSVRTLALDIRAWEVLLPVIDPQGEDFRSTTAFGMSVEARLRHASGLFIVVDPTRVPELRPDRGQGAMQATGDSYNYQTLVQSLHESSGVRYGSQARLSACVLVTKADSLRNCRQYQDIENAMARSDEMAMPTDSTDQSGWESAAVEAREISRAFAETLKELNLGNLVRTLQQSFDHTAFFPVSCIDEERIDRDAQGRALSLRSEPKPHGVAAPLLWMASEVRG